MTSGAEKRLIQEFKVNEKNDMYELSLVNDNLFHWNCVINGPSDSPYEGYSFKLDIKIDETYPMTAPQVKFATPIQHANVYSDGNICLDILNTKWSPILKISSVMISIISLLNEPNFSSPANPVLVGEYKRDKKRYEEIIKKHCATHCSSKHKIQQK